MIGLIKGTMRNVKSVPGLPAPIASFKTNVGGYPLEVVSSVEAVQSGSGNPSPDNVRPITGWAGANVTRTGKNVLTMDYLESGSISGSGAFINSPLRLRTSGSVDTMTPIKPSQVYTYSLQGAEGVTNLHFMEANEYSKDRVWLRNRALNRATGQYTPSADCYYVIFLIRKSDNSAIDVSDVDYLQVEVGSSTATAYEPYLGTTYTLLFGSTLYLAVIDWKTGVATVLGQKEDMGNLNYTKYDVAEGTLFRTQISGAKLEYNVDNLLCSAYHFELKEQRANGTYSIPDNVGNLDFINNSYSDATAFRTAMAGQELVYELTTPFDIQLTQTVITQLKKQNNIWCDSGNIDSVKYSNRQIYYGR